MLPALVCLDTETATLGGPPHLLELGAVRVVEGEIDERSSEPDGTDACDGGMSAPWL